MVSGTIIQPYNNGFLQKNCFIVNDRRIKARNSRTIYKIKGIFTTSKRKKNENYNLTKKDFIYVEIYDDWYYDKKAELLKTKNKKWVNNFINEEARPSQQTNLQNMYVAGGHTKTSVNIWSMESAIESGKIVANLIFEKNKKPKTYLHNHDEENIFIISLQKIDDLLFSFKLPSLIDVILIIILIIIINKVKNIIYQ